MASTAVSRLAVGAIACAALGCTMPSREPFVLGAPPWTDGEVERYDIVDAAHGARGSASWTWRRTEAGWASTFEQTYDGARQTSVVTVDEHLAMLSAETVTPQATFEAAYGADAITLRTRRAGAADETRSLARPADVVDNETCLELQRALPFAPDYRTEYQDFVSRGANRPGAMTLKVTGVEHVVVPAGAFEAWHVAMNGGEHDAWYTKEEPHLLVRYVNTAYGTQFVLRAWRASDSDAFHGRPEPAVVVPPEAPKVDAALLIAALATQLPLTIAFPIALVVWLSRRFHQTAKVWATGAATFALSQVVHVPLLWIVGLAGGEPRGLALLPRPAVVLSLGLAAGLCEEVARYVALRVALPKARSYGAALVFGAGHGGMESLLIGGLVFTQLLACLLSPRLPAALLGASGAETLRVLAAKLWSTPWYLATLSGLERVFAILGHVALSVMVMRSVVRRRLGWLLGAIAAHAALDALAVWSTTRFGAVVTEGLLAVAASAFAGALWAMREPAPVSPTRSIAANGP